MAYNFLALMVNDSDIVIGGIGNIGKLLANGNGVGTSSPHYFGIFHRLTYLVPCLKFFDHLVVIEVYSENAHGIRIQRTSQTGNFAPFHFGTFNRLLGVVPIGVMGNH